MRSLVCAAVLVAFSGCSSSRSPPASPSAAADAGAGDAAGAEAGATSAGDDASSPRLPSIEDGLLMAIQGTPPPQPGKPTPFVLVGCPAGGEVEIHAYVLADDGSKIDAGRRVAAYTEDGRGAEHVAVGTTFRVDVDESESFAAAPFVYRAIVASEPSFLDTSGHQFVARMLNPASPDVDDVGLAFPQKLVRCK